MPGLAALLIAIVPVHVVPVTAPPSSTEAPAANGSPAKCVNSSSQPAPCNLRYWGGHVISNVKIYAVFWGSGVNATTKSGIGGFFAALTNSDWMDWQNEYRTDIAPAGGGSGTGQLIGRGQFAGPITLTPSTSATCAGRSQSNPLQDSSIQSELVAQIGAGALPAPDANTLYMLYFPPGCVIGSNGSSSCVSGGFCAYHGTLTRLGQRVFYGVVPDFGPGSGCDLGCGNGTTFQNLCSASSHEIGEAITDAEVGLATVLGPPLAWYDQNNGENGDMCNAVQGTITSISDGTPYTVQQLYSVQTGLCQTTRTDANDFKVFMNPNTSTLAAGATIAIPVRTAVTAGSPPMLHLSLGALPAGVTGTLDATTIAAGASANLQLTATGTAAAAIDAVAVVTACAGSGACPSPGIPAHTASLLLQVTRSSATSDFAISIAPRGGTAIAPGQSIEYSVSTSATGGSPELISLSVTGLPQGVTGTFDVQAVNAGSGAILTLAASSGAPVSAPTTFAVKGVSPSVPAGHGATAQVQVVGLPAVSLSIPSTSLAGSARISATATAASGTTLSSLSISVDGHQVATTAASFLAVDWDTTQVLNGPHTLTATAVDVDGGSRSTQTAVTVTNEFTVAVAPGLITATLGRSPATFTVSTAAVGGVEPVALAVTGLPAGVQGSFDQPTVISGGAAVLTLIASPATAPGRTTFAVAATTRSVPSGHQVHADLLLLSAPSVALVTPTAGTVSGKVTITAAATVDSNAGIARLDLKDGDTVIGTGSVATLTVSWDSATVPNGTHALSAAVTDGAGNVATSPVVSVSVANRSGGGCSTGGASGAGSVALFALLAAVSRRRSRRGSGSSRGERREAISSVFPVSREHAERA